MKEGKIVGDAESEPVAGVATQRAKAAGQGTEEARWNRMTDIANVLLVVGTGMLLLLISGFCYLLALGYADMAVPYR